MERAQRVRQSVMRRQFLHYPAQTRALLCGERFLEIPLLPHPLVDWQRLLQAGGSGSSEPLLITPGKGTHNRVPIAFS